MWIVDRLYSQYLKPNLAVKCVLMSDSHKENPIKEEVTQTRDKIKSQNSDSPLVYSSCNPALKRFTILSNTLSSNRKKKFYLHLQYRLSDMSTFSQIFCLFSDVNYRWCWRYASLGIILNPCIWQIPLSVKWHEGKTRACFIPSWNLTDLMLKFENDKNDSINRGMFTHLLLQ